ncbi:sulfotransferase family 2 domain-containing protein [Methylobrevis pamukkalensis]|uniref:Sulfotransferase family protein n=1 Tax=Methylobrevis pamukkalensis TaxID=1439726 RepID=A0A1E3H5V6_9HYPH|nr:sulfotransferase family 2 domain-containing protein [Methylobrevis pamukkalensis]ODN71719.1 Sulfotransferase family protein [Methylobrevis pamukkalensis]
MSFFDRALIVHTHLEKTAGTSLVEGLRRVFGEDALYDTRGRATLKPEAMTSSQRRAIKVLSGHFHFGSHEHMFQRYPVYVACARDPYDRFCSFYHYTLANASHPGNEYYRGLSIGEAVEKAVADNKVAATNYLCTYFSTRMLASAASAKRIIDKHYVCVAPHNRVNDLIACFAETFNPALKLKEEIRANVGKVATYSQEGRELFEKHNQEDIELYHFIQENAERWITTFGGRLSRISRSPAWKSRRSRERRRAVMPA